MRLSKTGTVAIQVTRIALLVLVSAAPLKTHARAAQQTLEGFFRLSDQNCTDGKSDPCFYYLELTGEAARALYDNMRF